MIFIESYTTMRKNSINSSNRLEYIILPFFYHGSIVVCLTVVYEYDNILINLNDDILIININVVVKY
jgi:hypothetical protein